MIIDECRSQVYLDYAEREVIQRSPKVNRDE